MKLRTLASLAMALALAGCQAGRPGERAATLGETAQASPAVVTAAAVAEAVVQPSGTATAGVSRLPASNPGRSCRSDADCAVKDVGSCCGYHPQCLNKDTPTFPEQVKEKCAREGRVSTCGMLAVSGCECVSGQCQNQLQSDESLLPPADPAPLK